MSMTPEDLVLFAHTTDPAVKACQDEVHAKRVRYRGSASIPVSAVRHQIQTKKALAEKEHARLLGFETLLAALDHISPAKTIAVHHFSSDAALFSVAFEAGETQPLGGIAVWHAPVATHAQAGSVAAGASLKKDPASMGKH